MNKLNLTNPNTAVTMNRFQKKVNLSKLNKKQLYMERKYMR